MNKKNKKTKIKKNKGRPLTESQPNTFFIESLEIPTKTTCKKKFPCRVCKGDHLLKDCLGLSQVLEVWSSDSQHPVSSASGCHTNDTPSTNEFVIKLGKENS